MPDNSQPPPELNSPLASSAQRVLAIGGLLLCATGMLFGDIFAIFILHPNNARIGEAMFSAAQLIPQGNPEGILSHFTAIGGFLENRGTKVDAHSHIIHCGYVALLLAILQPWVALKSSTKLQLAWLYIISAALMPPAIFTIYYVGLAYSPFEHLGWASVVADLAGALMAVAVFIELCGLYRHWRENNAPMTPAYLIQGDIAARTLLVGGLLLISGGFIYGAIYAGLIKFGSGPTEVDIVKDIVTYAAGSQNDLLNQSFASYGNYLANRAINVAAHAHINEIGILLILLSFIQAFVMYSDKWKTYWARIAVLGATGLPVSIFLELKFGLLAGGFADTFGFIVIVALLAMLSGLLRHTGSVDAATGGEV
jgi:hypothetical protein